MDDPKFEFNQIAETMITETFIEKLCGFSYFYV